MNALTDANVGRLVADIRRDFRETASGDPSYSISRHARTFGFSMIRAVALVDEDKDIVRRVRAVVEAVDIVIDAEMDRIHRRQAEREDRAAGMPPHDRCFHRGKCSEDCPVDPCAGGRCTDPAAHAEGGHDW